MKRTTHVMMNESNDRRAKACGSGDQTLRDVVALADSGMAERALAVLSRGRLGSEAARNAKGVCLLRLGRVDEALRLFRSLVLRSDCTWMKPELPVVYRTNLCTALLLSGHPVGASDLLAGMEEQEHPAVLRLRRSIQNWERSLSFWHRMQWKLGLEPGSPVPIDFSPGDFVEPITVDCQLPLRSSLDSGTEPVPDSVSTSSSHAV